MRKLIEEVAQRTGLHPVTVKTALGLRKHPSRSRLRPATITNVQRALPPRRSAWLSAPARARACCAGRRRKPKGREITLLLGDNEYRPLNMHTMRGAYASGLASKGWTRAQMRTAGGWATNTMPARYDLSAQHAQVDAKGTTPRLKLVGSK